MKKYTYEITIEAQDESEADSRMRGISLLTSCTVVQKKLDNALLPLAQHEEELIRLHRKGIKFLKILHSCIQDPSQIDKWADELKNKQSKNTEQNGKV